MSRWAARARHEAAMRAAMGATLFGTPFPDGSVVVEDADQKLRWLESLDGGGAAAPGAPAHAGPERPPSAVVGQVLLPPCGITGDESKVSIGNLRYTLPVSELRKVVQFLDDRLGAHTDLPYGHNYYRASKRWELGARIDFSEDPGIEERMRGVQGRPEFLVVVDQSFLERLPLDGIGEVVLFFDSIAEHNCTRIDAPMDVSREALPVEKVERYAKAGWYQGFRKAQPFGEWQKGIGRTNAGVGFGVRGKRGKGIYLRIYDKFLESGGKQDCSRIEVEYTKSNGCAQQFHAELARAFREGRDVAKWIAGQVCSVVDFKKEVVRDGEKVMRRARFWSRVRVAAASAVVRPSYVKQKIVESIKRRVDGFAAFVAFTTECVRLKLGESVDSLSRLVQVLQMKGDGCRVRSQAQKFLDHGGDIESLFGSDWLALPV